MNRPHQQPQQSIVNRSSSNTTVKRVEQTNRHWRGSHNNPSTAAK